MSCNKRAKVNIILWGMPKSLSTLEIRVNLADIGFVGRRTKGKRRGITASMYPDQLQICSVPQPSPGPQALPDRAGTSSLNHEEGPEE